MNRHSSHPLGRRDMVKSQASRAGSLPALWPRGSPPGMATVHADVGCELCAWDPSGEVVLYNWVEWLREVELLWAVPGAPPPHQQQHHGVEGSGEGAAEASAGGGGASGRRPGGGGGAGRVWVAPCAAALPVAAGSRQHRQGNVVCGRSVGRVAMCALGRIRIVRSLGSPGSLIGGTSSRRAPRLQVAYPDCV